MRDEYKKPEFIFIGEEDEEKVANDLGDQRLFSALNELHKIKFPIGLRVLAFFVALISGLLAFLFSIVSLGWFLFALVTAFKYRKEFDKAWRQAKKLTVIFIGSAVAVFSPPLGIGFIFLYFIIIGDRISDSMMDRMMGQFHPNN